MVEESDDLAQFCEGIVVDTIMRLAFDFLRKKEEIESKRKTWKLKH